MTGLVKSMRKDDPRYPVVKREAEIFRCILGDFLNCMKSVKETLQLPDEDSHMFFGNPGRMFGAPKHAEE